MDASVISEETTSIRRKTMPKYKMIEWTDSTIGKFWAFSSQRPEEYFTFAYGHSIVQKLAAYLKPETRILDYGCGIGCLIQHLLRNEMSVFGTDYSDESVRVTNDKYKGMKQFGGAFLVEHLLEKNERFNVVIAIEVMEHLNDLKLQEFVGNIKRLLLPRGVLIISTPNEEDLKKLYVFCPHCEMVFHRWQHVRSWSEQSLCKYFSSQGFNRVSTFTTNFGLEDYKLSVRVRMLISKILHGWQAMKPPHLVGIFSPITKCEE